MLQYGVYPQPLGSVGCDRVDIRDIADAAGKALEGGASGTTVILAGPDDGDRRLDGRHLVKAPREADRLRR